MTSQPTPTTATVEVAPPRFNSILFGGLDLDVVVNGQAPDCFADLNLDQLVALILIGRDDYDLSGFFHTPLRGRDTVRYRQDIFRDLEQQATGACLTRFAEDMREVRGQTVRSGRLRFPLQRQAWHLTAALSYLAAVQRLGVGLSAAPVSSAGLSSFREFLTGYLSSAGFEALAAEAAQAQQQLDEVVYRLQVHGDRVQVSLPQDEDDYAADVTATFARFQQGPVRSYRSTLGFYEEMNHVEEAIASRVARLYPDVFAGLEAFHARHGHFTSEVMIRFDREVQFYLAYLDFVHRMRTAGLAMCYPEISDTPTPLQAVDAYDPALADKLIADNRSVVANTVELFGQEHIWVVTGPNQGGKTTFARMVGQLHYLASLGLLVPGRQARLPLRDEIFTHFERGENLHDLTGKLDDDLVRIRAILDAATDDSLLILNEIFTSTSAEDALWLATRVLHQVGDLGCACVCVTFLDELATLGPNTVSMVATIAHDDPASRTFHVVRRTAEGRAYAEAVAQRYGLTPRDLNRRLPL